MATFGGFAPGTYNAPAMNLITDVFATPGVARGMLVTAPGGMAVTVGVDAVVGDGVCILPNGGWVQIDQAATFTVPANSSGVTRTDAVIAFLDPTGLANPIFSLTYNTNWAGGFTGGSNNQVVVALVSVANGAASIANSNITNNPSPARMGNQIALMANNTASGEGLQVTEAFGQLSLTPYSTPPSASRDLVISSVQAGGSKSNWTFASNGNLGIPGAINPITGGKLGYGIQISDNSSAQQTLITSAAATPSARSLILQPVSASGTTQNYVFDPTGIMQIPGRLRWQQTMNGVNSIIVDIAPTDSTYVHYGFNFNSDQTLNFFNYTDSLNVFRLDRNGNITTPAGAGIPMTRNQVAGSFPIFTGNTTSPLNPPTGSLWVKA